MDGSSRPLSRRAFVRGALLTSVAGLCLLWAATRHDLASQERRTAADLLGRGRRRPCEPRRSGGGGADAAGSDARASNKEAVGLRAQASGLRAGLGLRPDEP